MIWNSAAGATVVFHQQAKGFKQSNTGRVSSKNGSTHRGWAGLGHCGSLWWRISHLHEDWHLIIWHRVGRLVLGNGGLLAGLSRQRLYRHRDRHDDGHEVIHLFRLLLSFILYRQPKAFSLRYTGVLPKQYIWDRSDRTEHIHYVIYPKLVNAVLSNEENS